MVIRRFLSMFYLLKEKLFRCLGAFFEGQSSETKRTDGERRHGVQSVFLYSVVALQQRGTEHDDQNMLELHLCLLNTAHLLVPDTQWMETLFTCGGGFVVFCLV